MPIDRALRDELTQQINLLFGLPTSETLGLRRWIKGEFELGMDLEQGPTLWIESRWCAASNMFWGIRVDCYAQGEERHTDLQAGFAHLGSAPLYHIHPRAARMDVVIDYLEECGKRALRV